MHYYILIFLIYVWWENLGEIHGETGFNVFLEIPQYGKAL